MSPTHKTSTRVLEYQVSESATADRKYFSNFQDALELARELSTKQPYPVYIDVFDHQAGELASYWYTISSGKLVKHK